MKNLQGLLASLQRPPPFQPPVGEAVQIQKCPMTHTAQVGGQIQLEQSPLPSAHGSTHRVPLSANVALTAERSEASPGLPPVN